MSAGNWTFYNDFKEKLAKKQEDDNTNQHNTRELCKNACQGQLKNTLTIESTRIEITISAKMLRRCLKPGRG